MIQLGPKSLNVKGVKIILPCAPRRPIPMGLVTIAREAGVCSCEIVNDLNVLGLEKKVGQELKSLFSKALSPLQIYRCLTCEWQTPMGGLWDCLLNHKKKIYIGGGSVCVQGHRFCCLGNESLLDNCQMTVFGAPLCNSSILSMLIFARFPTPLPGNQTQPLFPCSSGLSDSSLSAVPDSGDFICSAKQTALPRGWGPSCAGRVEILHQGSWSVSVMTAGT
ncbi:Hypothetical predicted protein [Lynx pardinus]|uniref:Uncharacterized protein n=1 Tax=Lynx pardinus TaxID=191816 RepID=A0A485MAB3_LYNPA|nr:Hypothetical predicted protein [Lynx pardinus]